MPPSRFHGVLITFRRPDDLATFFDVLSTQTAKFDTLVVVDNDDDPTIRAAVESIDLAPALVSYISCAENMGPAGGIEAGIHHVLEHASDDDWVVLLDDDDPPLRADGLAALRSIALSQTTKDQRCAGVGMWGARLNRRTGRVRALEAPTPESVDYLPGSALPHYRVGPLRMVGPPPAEMFFGFDDLELGLRLIDAGWQLYSTGLAAEHGLGHMVKGRQSTIRVETATWRRYYSLRNGIYVLRRHGALTGAIWRSLAAGIAKPLVNLPRAPRQASQHLLLNIRAIRDGWSGRLGKRIDPVGLPTPKRNAAPQ